MYWILLCTSFLPSAHFFKVWALEMCTICSYLPDWRRNSLFVPLKQLPEGSFSFWVYFFLHIPTLSLAALIYYVIQVALDTLLFPLFASSQFFELSIVFLIVFKLTSWSWLELMNVTETAISPCRTLLETHLFRVIPPVTNTRDVSSSFLMKVCYSLLMLYVAAFAVR